MAVKIVFYGGWLLLTDSSSYKRFALDIVRSMVDIYPEQPERWGCRVFYVHYDLSESLRATAYYQDNQVKFTSL